MTAAEHERAGAIHRVYELERLAPRRVGKWPETDEQHRERREAGAGDERRAAEGLRERERPDAVAERDDPHEGAQQDRGRLTAEAAPRDRDRSGQRGEHEPGQVGRKRAAHGEHGERDDGHGDELEPVHPAGAAHVGRADRERERRHRDRGREREAEPGCDPADHTGPARAHRHPELARRRAGEEIRDGDELGQLLLVDPAPLLDVRATEVPDVRDGAAERRQTETKRDAEDLGGRSVSPQSRVAPGFQSGSSRPVERVCSAREDEEKVGEAVEIHDDERGDLVVVAGPEGLALGAAADGARDVEPGGGLAPAGEDEAPKLRQVCVEPVAVRLQPVDHRLRHAQTPLEPDGHATRPRRGRTARSGCARARAGAHPARRGRGPPRVRR